MAVWLSMSLRKQLKELQENSGELLIGVIIMYTRVFDGLPDPG